MRMILCDYYKNDSGKIENMEYDEISDSYTCKNNRKLIVSLKQDMQFRRYLSKGTANVLAESTLLAIARNINKLHNKI